MSFKDNFETIHGLIYDELKRSGVDETLFEIDTTDLMDEEDVNDVLGKMIDMGFITFFEKQVNSEGKQFGHGMYWVSRQFNDTLYELSEYLHNTLDFSDFMNEPGFEDVQNEIIEKSKNGEDLSDEIFSIHDDNGNEKQLHVNFEEVDSEDFDNSIVKSFYIELEPSDFNNL